MAGEKERVDAYMNIIKRLEPEIAMIDQDAAAASIAISLKRIADAQEHQAISLKRLADANCPSLAAPRSN